jgi:AcrR family transcriptional regulator
MDMRFAKSTKEDKALTIIEAAQKRFALYGVEKTSMREIAADLRMSKGSIYYYFPDKENLYKAVIEKEQSVFLKMLEENVSAIADPSDSLVNYALSRINYFKKLINLGQVRSEAMPELKPLIANTLRKFHEKEKIIVMKIIEKGKSNGDYNIVDSYQVASLYLDLLRGLRSTLLSNKTHLFINEEEYQVLLEKVRGFTELFIKGLKYRNNK